MIAWICLLGFIILVLVCGIGYLLMSRVSVFDLAHAKQRIKELETDLRHARQLSIIEPGPGVGLGEYINSYQLSETYYSGSGHITRIVGYTENVEVADSYVKTDSDKLGCSYNIERRKVFKLGTGEYAIFKPFECYQELDTVNERGIYRYLKKDLA